MYVRITIETQAPRQQIEGCLLRLTENGPFAIRDLAHHGAREWSFTLQPVQPGLAVGFGKVAELQFLLAREFDVNTVERLPRPAKAAAG